MKISKGVFLILSTAQILSYWYVTVFLCHRAGAIHQPCPKRCGVTQGWMVGRTITACPCPYYWKNLVLSGLKRLAYLTYAYIVGSRGASQLGGTF